MKCIIHKQTNILYTITEYVKNTKGEITAVKIRNWGKRNYGHHRGAPSRTILIDAFKSKYEELEVTTAEEVKALAAAVEKQLELKKEKAMQAKNKQFTNVSFNEYQNTAHSTASYPPCSVQSRMIPWVYPALKLSGEAGEVAEKLGKIIRDKDGRITNDDVLMIQKELGDVLWYIAELCTCLNITLQDVADLNLEKLADRAARGQIHGSGDNR